MLCGSGGAAAVAQRRRQLLVHTRSNCSLCDLIAECFALWAQADQSPAPAEPYVASLRLSRPRELRSGSQGLPGAVTPGARPPARALAASATAARHRPVVQRWRPTGRVSSAAPPAAGTARPGRPAGQRDPERASRLAEPGGVCSAGAGQAAVARVGSVAGGRLELTRLGLQSGFEGSKAVAWNDAV